VKRAVNSFPRTGRGRRGLGSDPVATPRYLALELLTNDRATCPYRAERASDRYYLPRTGLVSVDAGEPPLVRIPKPGVAHGYPPAPGTNWWMISGLMVALGAVMIGIGFVVLAMGIAAQSSSVNYLAAFYALFGIGIAFIGLSWVFARMTPRLK
jgi:hypothetical protein